MTDTPLVAGQAYGLRTWRVTTEGGGEVLTGPHRRTSWPAGGEWLEATCASPGGHAAPAPGCVCGVHAWHPARESARRVLSARWLVPGIVEGRGIVELHYDGFRAEAGRPLALLEAPGRNGRQIARLAERYGAEVVRVRGPDDAVAYCRARGLGFAPSVVTDLLGPAAVRHEARSRSRRRRVARLRVAGAVLLAGVLCLIGLMLSSGEPSGRVLNGRTGEIRTP